jgi:hypothetical protein
MRNSLDLNKIREYLYIIHDDHPLNAYLAKLALP